MHSYLKRNKHGVKISDTQSAFQMLFPGTPQGFRLGLISFNIILNDFILFNKDVQVACLADDNTISVARNSITELIKVLRKESK